MEKHEIASLKDLLSHNGWKVLEKELNIEIEEIESLLFTIKKGADNDKTYSEHDLLRGARNVYKTLLSSPSDLIESFGTIEIEES